MATDKNGATFHSGDRPKSAILNSSFIQRLNSLFGFRTSRNDSPDATEFEKKYGIKLVRVDLNNPAYRVRNAAIGSTFQSQYLHKDLERYFDAYLNETSTSYSDISDRQKRLNELSYAYYNDCFIFKACQLCADEATQQDVQDRLISIESPNAAFVEKTYSLLNMWGVTQNAVHQACLQIQLYGEAFWAQRVSPNGIEKIMPIFPNQIMERLEFSPAHMARYLAERDGWNSADRSRGSKIADLVDMLSGQDAFDAASNIADMFDTKLFGFELEGGTVVPPWTITHFRLDCGEFFPYGRPPLLNALGAFKASHSTQALQGLARAMSFPITMYKVKNTEGMLPAQAFDVVNTVREQYDNLGVSPSTQGSEVYTVNTKIWVPDGLVDIDVKESKSDYDYVGDLENYQKQVALACGVPIGYIDPNGESWGESGIALKEQLKVFERHIFNIQSAFLQGLGELIRMHYAITGEFDYNTPFIVSMRFPAEEETDSKRSAQQSSLELSQGIIELIQTVLGVEEDEPLPEDVVTDILSKYSFLDPTDIEKWLKLTSFAKQISEGDDEGDDDDGGDDEDMEESQKRRNTKGLQLLEETRIKRLREVKQRYKESKNEIFMKFFESQHLTDVRWDNPVTGGSRHYFNVPPIRENDSNYDSYQQMAKTKKLKNKKGYNKLKETLAMNSAMRVNNPKKVESVNIQEAMKLAAQNFADNEEDHNVITSYGNND